MTNADVSNSFAEVYNDFWTRYRDRQPKDPSPEWERMATQAALLRKKHPLMEKAINAMMTEITERARGRGNVPGECHQQM